MRLLLYGEIVGLIKHAENSACCARVDTFVSRKPRSTNTVLRGGKRVRILLTGLLYWPSGCGRCCVWASTPGGGATAFYRKSHVDKLR